MSLYYNDFIFAIRNANTYVQMIFASGVFVRQSRVPSNNTNWLTTEIHWSNSSTDVSCSCFRRCLVIHRKCSKIPSKAGFCRYFTVLEVSLCRYGIKRWVKRICHAEEYISTMHVDCRRQTGTRCAENLINEGEQKTR